MLLDEIRKGENKRLELKEKLPLNENFEINESGNFVSIIFYRPEMPNSDEKMPNNAEKLLNLKERKAKEILKKLVDKGI
jgi:hypothetical protein